MLRRLISIVAAASAFTALVAGPAASATNDPYFSKQWHLTRIQAEQAWATTTGGNALVAVVDTGVDLTHPDLAANVVSYSDADMVEPNGTCSGNPRVCTQDAAQDKNGHGTHVAGIVAALAGNGIGGAGIAPGAKILPVRVLDAEGSGSFDQIADGVRYASDHGAKVINLSLGFSPAGADIALRELGFFTVLEDAINYAWDRGAVITVAAGNDSIPLCSEPAAYPNVVCVGATDQFDLISFYSNSDALHPNYLVAPGGWGLGGFSLGNSSPTAATCGGEIFSTYLRSESVWCSPEGGYEGISGTSMATPAVSGVAALLAGRGLNNQEIVACLKSSADDLGAPGRDPIYGYGRINAARAVTTC